MLHFLGCLYGAKPPHVPEGILYMCSNNGCSSTQIVIIYITIQLKTPQFKGKYPM